MYAQPHSWKLQNIRANPQVSLHLNSDEQGNRVVTFEGSARTAGGHPLGHEVAAYSPSTATECGHRHDPRADGRGVRDCPSHHPHARSGLRTAFAGRGVWARSVPRGPRITGPWERMAWSYACQIGLGLGVGSRGGEVAPAESGEPGECGDHAESGQPGDGGPVEAGSEYRAKMGPYCCVGKPVAGRYARPDDLDQERPQDQGVKDRHREPRDEPVEQSPRGRRGSTGLAPRRSGPPGASPRTRCRCAGLPRRSSRRRRWPGQRRPRAPPRIRGGRRARWGADRACERVVEVAAGLLAADGGNRRRRRRRARRYTRTRIRSRPARWSWRRWLRRRRAIPKIEASVASPTDLGQGGPPFEPGGGHDGAAGHGERRWAWCLFRVAGPCRRWRRLGKVAVHGIARAEKLAHSLSSRTLIRQ